MANPQIENGYTKIANEIMEALNKIRIPGEAHQVLGVILRKTYGFSKKEDFISTTQFMQDTGLSRVAIQKARKKLLDMKLITVSQKGYSKILNYSFQKDYNKWIPVSKKGYCIQKRIQGAPIKVQNCIPKGSPQNKEIKYTKEMVPQIGTNKVFDYFCLKYKETLKTDYIPNFGKDKKLVKDLLKIVNDIEFCNLIDSFFKSDDEFIQKSGYTLGVFKSQVNKLRSQKPVNSLAEFYKKEK